MKAIGWYQYRVGKQVRDQLDYSIAWCRDHTGPSLELSLRTPDDAAHREWLFITMNYSEAQSIIAALQAALQGYMSEYPEIIDLGSRT